MKLVTIATYPTSVEARMAVNRLSSEGIRGVVNEEHVTSTLWHASPAFGGVKVQVDEQDADTASQLLSRLGEEDLDTNQASRRKSWTCPKCAELVSGEFAVCWSRGTAEDGTEDPTFRTPDDDEQAQGQAEQDDLPQRNAKPAIAPRRDAIREREEHEKGETQPILTRETGNPYQSPQFSGSSADVPEEPVNPALDERAARAWRASVLGLPFVVLMPFLNIYSTWLLLQIGLAEGNLSAQGWRHYFYALALNMLVAAAWSSALGFIIQSLFSG